MKKVILASVMAVAAISTMQAAQAATGTKQICGGAAGNATANPDTASDGSQFVRNAFTPKCSNNVYMVGDDRVTYFRVGSMSSKGSRTFGGSTVGGAVASSAACNATGCGTAISDAAAAATNAASS